METQLQVLEAETPSLIKHLQAYKAESYQVIGLLKNSLEGKQKVVCLVDGFPENFSTVIVFLPEPIYPDSYMSVFTSDVTKFEDIFWRNCEIFDWSKPRVLSAMQPAVREVMENTLATIGVSYTKTKPHCMLECPYVKHKDIEAPPGFLFSPLREEHITDVANTWEFCEDGCEKLISLLLEKYATVALLTEGGELAGWFLEQPDSSQGMLYIHPKFRGERLSRYLIEKLACKMMAKERPAYVFVDQTNKKSLRAHESCGYQRSGVYPIWLYTDPVA